MTRRQWKAVESARRAKRNDAVFHICITVLWLGTLCVMLAPIFLIAMRAK